MIIYLLFSPLEKRNLGGSGACPADTPPHYFSPLPPLLPRNCVMSIYLDYIKVQKNPKTNILFW